MSDLIPITIHADLTGWYEGYLDEDITVSVMFPYDIVKQYFEETSSAYPEYDFDEWYKHMYEPEDMDGLFSFAVDHGFKPKQPDDVAEYCVEFTYTVSVLARDTVEAVELAEKRASAYINTRDHAIYVDSEYWG